MILAIPKELKEREKRVALTPDVVKALVAAGYECRVEKDAGLSSYFTNDKYTAAGATLVDQAQTLYAQADVVLKVNAPTPEEIG
jgi:NAD/NADP transhydrogenase alpha subunit